MFLSHGWKLEVNILHFIPVVSHRFSNYRNNLLSLLVNRYYKTIYKGIAKGGPGVPVTPPFASLF